MLNASSAVAQRRAQRHLRVDARRAVAAGAPGGRRNHPTGWRSWTRSSETGVRRAIPAACATSSTLTASKPRAANRSMATSAMCLRRGRRRPASAEPGTGSGHCTSTFAAPFRFGTRCHIVCHTDPMCRVSHDERQSIMDNDQQAHHRHRARHRDPRRRGLHRRDVRGLLTVSAASRSGDRGGPVRRSAVIRPRSRLASAPAGGGAPGAVRRAALPLRHPQAVVSEEPHHPRGRRNRSTIIPTPGPPAAQPGSTMPRQAPYLHALGVLATSNMLVPARRSPMRLA